MSLVILLHTEGTRSADSFHNLLRLCILSSAHINQPLFYKLKLLIPCPESELRVELP
jgi:hypothetical protein